MSSKRHLRRKACSAKQAYPSEDAAWGACRAIKRRKGDSLWPYACKWCGSWHIGHPPSRVLQAVRAQQSNRRAALGL